MIPFPSTRLLVLFEGKEESPSSFCLALFLREAPPLVATASFVSEGFEIIWQREDDKTMEWVNTNFGNDSVEASLELIAVQMYAAFPYRASNRWGPLLRPSNVLEKPR